MDQQQIEYDIYFEGSKQQLFTMLYPLTGPNSPIFDHLDINKIQFNDAHKKLEFTYKTKEFTNIDKQDEEIIYRSVCLPTHSNYFYSTFVPSANAFVWRSVNRMMQLRPCPKMPPIKQKQPKSNQQNPQQIQAEHEDPEQTKQLNLIVAQDNLNKPIRQIYNVPNTPKLHTNWDISKEEYISRLCQ